MEPHAKQLMALQDAIEAEDRAKEHHETLKRATKRLIFECAESGISREIIAEVVGVTRDRIKQIIREVRPFDAGPTNNERLLAEYNAAIAAELNKPHAAK